MSLFVDLRQIKSSVTNLSEMVDKISTSVCKDKLQKERKKSVDSALYGSSIYKPTTLGFGVRFSQSQEDIFNDMPSSRLRSHMSLPNLGKNENKTATPRPKIVEINDENSENENKNPIQISSENLNDWIVASLNKRPHFDDSGHTHPIDFLESVKYYISLLNMGSEKTLNFIISCLEGLPLMWARCFKNEFQDVEDFYEAFEQEFWGPERQKAILYDMKLGKYDESKSKMTMSEYFLYKVSNYKHLSPPPSDLEIVYSLAAHFPSAVELELRLTPKPTLREAYSLLRRREGEANDFLPNYLYEMCEAFQRGSRPESARRTEEQQTPSVVDDKNKRSK
ncbi:jg24522 [Pararge aegeria aegeria]|uniref:Jg24522 protein n=1 Tax=Pararge aegeria aegeria TaxID=348720 RepID=A0A8S4R6I6_9NEOP|nr:jg24522 [Pararge aegeria aegeria]